MFFLIKTAEKFIPREARAEGPSIAKARAQRGSHVIRSGAKPREFERKIYLYPYISELIFQKVATEY